MPLSLSPFSFFVSSFTFSTTYFFLSHSQYFLSQLLSFSAYFRLLSLSLFLSLCVCVYFPFPYYYLFIIIRFLNSFLPFSFPLSIRTAEIKVKSKSRLLFHKVKLQTDLFNLFRCLLFNFSFKFSVCLSFDSSVFFSIFFKVPVSHSEPAFSVPQEIETESVT
jgi:hypothetical protein